MESFDISGALYSDFPDSPVEGAVADFSNVSIRAWLPIDKPYPNHELNDNSQSIVAQIQEWFLGDGPSPFVTEKVGSSLAVD